MPEESGQSGKDEEPVETVQVEEPAPSEKEEKILSPEPEKFNPPLNFSGNEPAFQASPVSKMEYEVGDRGRQRKYYETIALLETTWSGDTWKWERLDEQMQRYYRREYPAYFGRDSKAKQQQRQENKVKAARIRHERLQREIKGTAAKVPHERVAPIDLQSRRKRISGE